MVFYQYIISKEKEDKTMFKKNGLLKSPDSKPKEKYLLLFAVAAALLAAVWYLPAIAAALRVLLGLATPFAGGLALA